MMNVLKLGITGHRILEHPIVELKEQIKSILCEYKKHYDRVEIYNGLALGFDQLVCEVIIDIQNNLSKFPGEIVFIACIPCKGQDKVWLSAHRERYKYLLSCAEKIEMVDDGPYAAWKMHKRNQFIVDNSMRMLCYWNIEENSGGTVQCMHYALKKNIPYANLYL